MGIFHSKIDIHRSLNSYTSRKSKRSRSSQNERTIIQKSQNMDLVHELESRSREQEQITKILILGKYNMCVDKSL